MALAGTDTFTNNIDQDMNTEYMQQGDTVTENMNREEYEQRPLFDPNNVKVSVKSTDMSENMVLYVVEKTILAFEAATDQLETQEEGAKLDFNTLVSKFIKLEMELGYKGASWHVITGENFGGYFTHEEFNSIVFTMNGKWITIFRSNVPVVAPDEASEAK